MASTSSILLKRIIYNDCYNDFDGDFDNCNSAWDRYGRWIVLGVVLFIAIVALFLFGCFSARRRRRLQRQPFYGTAWMAPPPPYQQQPPVEQQYNGYQTGLGGYAPPSYNQQNSGQQYGGYYGAPQEPSQTYYPAGGSNVYSPPQSPPPHKG